MYDVTSWFQVQLENPASEPVRRFSIGTSDYSDRVTKWPRIKRTMNDVKSLKVILPVENVDGHFNGFYDDVYTIPNTGTLQLGFTHATSGEELVTLYTGFLKNVRYKEELAELEFRDNLNDFQTRKVGDSDVTVVFSSQIPSDIGWDLCTCYGGLSNVASTSNPDIDYTTFLSWAKSFSGDSVLMEAAYNGMKVTEALTNLSNITDSAIWVEGDGKINFLRPEEPSSLDLTLTRDHFHDLEIDVESVRIINKAWVYWDWAVESNYFQSKVFAIDSVSVNSYGLHEKIIEDESIWYVNSVSSLVHAQRKIKSYRDPPKRFLVDTSLFGMRHQLAETVRLVDSFYNVTSDACWRLIENQLDMETGEVTFELDEALALNGFYLDVSLLDGDEVLL